MKLDANDPRLTAYVLGELDDEQRQEIEAAMAECEQSRQLVDSLAATTKLLSEQLGSDAKMKEGLGEERRAALEARLSGRPKEEVADEKVVDLDAARRKRLKVVIPIAAAASVLLALGIGSVGFVTMKAEPDSASQGPPINAYSLPEPTLASPRHAGRQGKMGGVGNKQQGLYGVSGPRTSSDTATRQLPVGRHVITPIADPADKTTATAGKDPNRNADEDGEVDGRFAQAWKNKRGRDGKSGEKYSAPRENPFLRVAQAPLSTFSVDVDTASYANVRRFLTQNQRPPRGAVRVEELINYFDYEYAPPRGEHPFSVHVAASDAPWNRRHRLVRIALQGRKIAPKQRPASNLVFLLDVSGSMSAPNKLPLLKQALTVLVRRLDGRDRVAMVVYAGASGLVLNSTPCTPRGKRTILAALDRLQSGGSTNAGAGIELAYGVAAKHLIDGGVNRVILATDGDFNVGTTHGSALVDLVRQRAQKKIFLTVLGFGMGNYKDATLEKLADKGNGNYAYIDTVFEARKVLGEQLSGTLVTIAKDVKIQVEFNPRHVAAYRLIGYENRLLRARDFADDKKDAGEIGAGHQVTALYELVLAGGVIPDAPKLRYQPTTGAKKAGDFGGELLTVKLRYKHPDGARSKLLKRPVAFAPVALDQADTAFRFAAAVAWFGMTLRGSRYAGESKQPWSAILELARGAEGSDRHGYRREFQQLVQRAGRVVGGYWSR